VEGIDAQVELFRKFANDDRITFNTVDADWQEKEIRLVVA
jgi:hypothetical protein